MTAAISESRFHMWRTVTAIIHADGVVTPHEVNFIVTNMLSLPLSSEQRDVLKEDIAKPADPKALYKKITSRKDIDDFFHLARAISWSDGEFDETEASLLRDLFDLPFEAKSKPPEVEPSMDSDVASFIRGLVTQKSRK